MITLHQFPTALGLPVSASPFCASLEIYFRLTGREYQTNVGAPLASPTKSLPFVNWPDGEKQGDSGVIIARCEAEGPALDEGLADGSNARIGPLLEQVTGLAYYCNLYARFSDMGWTNQKKVLRGMMPSVAVFMFGGFIRKSQIKKCAAKGITQPADVARGVPVVEAVIAQLGEKDFMLDDTPRVADCVLWGQLIACAATPEPNPLRGAIRGSKPLVDWLERMAARVDWSIPSYAA